MPITVKASASGVSMTMEVSAKYTLRITETAVEMVITTSASMMGQTESETIISYLIDSPTGIKQATLVGGDYWQVTDFNEFGAEKIADLFDANLPDADYSFFIKTSTGFKMSDEFLANLMEEMLENADMSIYAGFDYTISANYYVSEGRLDSEQVYLKLSGTVYESGMAVKTDVTIKATNKYSGFGTTTVTIPDGAKTAFGI